MLAERGIRVAATVRDAVIVDVRIQSDRPQQAAAVFCGKPVDQVPSLAGMLFNLCGKAQTAAAQLAIDAALNRESAPQALLTATRLVTAEMVSEYLWRFALDMPGLVEHPMGTEPYRQWRAQSAGIQADPGNDDVWAGFQAALRAFLRQQLLGIAPAAWRSLDVEAAGDWLAGSQGLAAVMLREAAPLELRAAGGALLDTSRTPQELSEIVEAMGGVPGFLANPLLKGAPRETGAISRQWERPLVARLRAQGQNASARLVSRLYELADEAENSDLCCMAAFRSGVRCGALRTQAEIGAGWVETARGLLVHRVEVESDRVSAYQVLAPTDWNFGPDGALVHALRGAGLPAPEEAERGIRFSCLSLDPCVAHTVEVVHA